MSTHHVARSSDEMNAQEKTSPSTSMLHDALSLTTGTASEILGNILPQIRLYQWHMLDACVTCIAIWTLLQWIHTSRLKLRTTQLRGPPSESFLYGVGKLILDADDSGAIYEAWAQEYGAVYEVPSTLGSRRVILCDPKAIAHFYAKEIYVRTSLTKQFIAMMFGKGLLWAQGEDHRRQRKSLTPAFSIAAIRHLTSIFYDSAYKAKGAWDISIESNGGDIAVIDVQNWMNHISLDTVGLAGFSHNFGALEGRHATVTEVFDTFGASSGSTALNKGLLLLGQIFPILVWLPTPRVKLIQRLNIAMEEISTVLLARTRKEMEMGVVGGKEERSIIGLLIKGASVDSEFHLTKEEIMAQMKMLLIAGYETTSISLTWALLELSRNPDVQTTLRKELLEHGADPTYDQLSNGLPYLDAVVHEILRLYLPVVGTTRVANEDDVIPLSEPVRTKSGDLVDSLIIAKGALVSISMECMNRSAAFWGEDAKVFRPSRWLEDGENGIPAKAKEIQGYRHLLSFIDGPRMCLGRNFAVTELKVVLTVLVKNFMFELRDGVDSKIEIGRGLFPRPRLAGEEGSKLPLRVRPYIA